MEELQEALKGKTTDCGASCELHESVLSLPKDCSNLQQQKCKCVQHLHTKSTKHNKSSTELSFTTHLALRRHSFSSVNELRCEETARTHNRMLNYYSSPNLNEHDDFMQTDYNMQNVNYFILSPIEEYSEISTRTSSSIESKEFSERISHQFPLSSCSCDFLSTKSAADVKFTIHKSQTFPRSKADLSLNNSDCAAYKLDDKQRFPLTPREIDPFSYYQLHTADSQEDLHEFLLLESACMNEHKGSGLAAAFCDTKDSCN